MIVWLDSGWTNLRVGSSMKWIKSKFQGVRYREHATRKNGVVPDRYYTIFYKLEGKMIQEALGWASESWEEVKNGKKIPMNWTEKRAAAALAELQKNQSLGTGPRTLREKRTMQSRAAALQKAESLTLSEFWEQDYVHSLKARMKSSSWEKEVSHYENRIKLLMGDKPLKDITSTDVERMVETMKAKKLSKRTQQYAIGTVFRIWKHAAKRKFVKTGENPASGILVGKINNERLRVLTPSELSDILKYLSINNQVAHDITLFCAFTGCRFSEAANLAWEYINFEEETVLFAETKNGDSRENDLDTDVIAMLKRRIPGKVGEHVFIGNRGSIFTEPPSAFRVAVKKLGLNEGRGSRDRASFHTLRHTAATIAARNGATAQDLKLTFGWRTHITVFRYVKSHRDDRRQMMKQLARSLKGENEKIVKIEETA